MQVQLEYHPDRGAYCAALGSLGGWGETERRAIAALADRLRDAARSPPARGDRVTDLGHALVAAAHWPTPELIDWLAARAREPVLHEAA